MVKPRNLVISLTAAVVLALALNISALADQITIGNSAQSVVITSTGTSGPADLTLGACAAVGSGQACTLSGMGFDGTTGQMGTYSLVTSVASGTVDVTASNGASELFPINANGATSLFTFNFNGGGSVSGAVTFGQVADHTTTPTFSGTWVVGGSTFPFDFTLSALSNNFDTIAFGPAGTTDSAAVSSGEFVTPEPASLGLFGLGLLGLAFAYRRRMKALA